MLIAETWLKGKYALNANSKPVSPSSSEATCLCLKGYLIHNGLSQQPFINTIRRLFPDRIYGVCPIVAFNDHPDTVFSDIEKVLNDHA